MYPLFISFRKEGNFRKDAKVDIQSSVRRCSANSIHQGQIVLYRQGLC